MSSGRLESIFKTNSNKDFIRNHYDKALIESWYKAQGQPLKYLGLPGWELLDILAWQEFLGGLTTIEREENPQHLMFLRANVANVEHRLHSLYGEFDKILLTGRDEYGKAPDWPYGLVNLDYFGGLIYPNLARPKAIKKLVQNQATYNSSFLLVITQHLRDRDSAGEKEAFLGQLRGMLKSGTYDYSLHSGIDGIIDWYLSADIPDAARQALYLNYLLRDLGESEHFDVRCYAPILYSGTGRSSMIHFTAEFRFKGGIGHRVASAQTLIELINLGLREVREGALEESRLAQPRL
jgi:hypothetical protein